jgi:membrane-bound ClpP family serine protease
MIVLGIVLLLLGWLTGTGILNTIGIILIVIGAVLLLLGAVNRPVFGRKYWY